ncbi:ABC transporter ATP-binding protein [Glycomyces buryatensis]|uniref:ABC transporter ATP-binding protein n=1 Tax=Glycomyces buryatensis TaxID=2570927 RepID=A0A4S8QFW8_9ACTN|nr:ABC transporter ATP-binding protein [Glycomyces buryatensis]THV42591.1 ABC transporter ATP-binding protein [Glycomyces buryatensis]
MSETLRVIGDTLPGADLNAPLLEVENLQVEFKVRGKSVPAVRGATFTLEQGRTLAVVGESGSGKSVTSQAIMGIVDDPPGRVTGGEVRLHGIDLLKQDEETRRTVRGNHIAVIFQDALSALNPLWSVGFQIGELFRVHRGSTRAEAKKRAIELLDQVGIPDAKNRVGHYPHQFSGGMRQRVMIAMALALDPEVLIADEPTTALDVTVQAQIMRLLKQIQDERHMGLILITHDLGVVADVADEVAVMYAGEVVERATIRDTFKQPAHPYTKALLRAIPRVDTVGQELEVIRGLPPNPASLPGGCPFHPRCWAAEDKCSTEVPPMIEAAPEHRSRCHFATEVYTNER